MQLALPSNSRIPPGNSAEGRNDFEEAPCNGWRTVSALAQTIEVPASPRFDHVLVFELATASDLASGMARILSRARLAAGAARVEWWEGDEFVAADGLGTGRPRRCDLGTFGAFVFYGGELDFQLAAGLQALLPLLRRLRADETLAAKAGELVRRNELLDEFAGLVAHELKTPLHEALLAEDASQPLREALDLVDALLSTARDARPLDGVESPTDTLDAVVHELGERAVDLEVTSDLATSLPITVGALRIIVRNFLTNALAAGARHVHVAMPDQSTLVVDDDGVGPADVGYESGSGLGLELARRIAGTFGAQIELASRPYGGARAMLVFGERR
jgi:signal transduction histidine kinase